MLLLLGNTKPTPTYFDLSHHWKCDELGSTAPNLIVFRLHRNNKLWVIGSSWVISWLIRGCSWGFGPISRLQYWLAGAVFWMLSADVANTQQPGERAEPPEVVLMSQGVALPSVPVPHWGGWMYSTRDCDICDSLCGTECDSHPCWIVGTSHRLRDIPRGIFSDFRLSGPPVTIVLLFWTCLPSHRSYPAAWHVALPALCPAL